MNWAGEKMLREWFFFFEGGFGGAGFISHEKEEKPYGAASERERCFVASRFWRPYVG